jgi:hypothetical protein
MFINLLIKNPEVEYSTAQGDDVQVCDATEVK